MGFLEREWHMSGQPAARLFCQETSAEMLWHTWVLSQIEAASQNCH